MSPWCSRSSPLRRALAWGIGLPALLLVLAYPLGLLRIWLATLAGRVLGWLDSTQALETMVGWLPFDPVYGSIAAKMLTGVKPTVGVRGMSKFTGIVAASPRPVPNRARN